MRKALLAFIVLVSAFTVVAQDGDYEYGRASELKGLTKVYIDTGSDLKGHDKIESELTKAKLGLEFVNSGSDCQFLITFRFVTRYHGRGVVLIAQGDGKPRLVLSFDDIQQTALEHNPLNNFIKEVIKTYKKANEK